MGDKVIPRMAGMDFFFFGFLEVVLFQALSTHACSHGPCMFCI